MKNLIKKFLSFFGFKLVKINSKIKTHIAPVGVNLINKTYTSYIPDKYSDNVEIYRENTHPFFNESDIENWTKGSRGPVGQFPCHLVAYNWLLTPCNRDQSRVLNNRMRALFHCTKST